ncbi:MAG: hypothetical protein M1816_000006 [Peltula sp. TS41687]|nr:MAG: hypothetical protein M1816_000006 [Peltula sp. TS41687]
MLPPGSRSSRERGPGLQSGAGVTCLQVPGAASLNDGVMIATTNLKGLQLETNNTILSLGPGHTWAQVYDYLGPYDLTVVGGRYGPVGVAGLLLGGGVDYFGNQYGWAMNNVVKYEVVLANSSIVEANANQHADLFWALKGGSNNYGIVTRFDLITYNVEEVYGGTAAFDASSTPGFLEAVTSFFQPGGGVYDPQVAINPCIYPVPSSGTVLSNLVAFYRGNDATPESLWNLTRIPAATQDIGLRSSFDMFMDNPNIDLPEVRTNNVLYWSTSVKATAEAIEILNTTFTQAVLENARLKKMNGTSMFMCMQAITTNWQQAARDLGGDAIDLDPANGTFLAIVFPTIWPDEEDQDFIYSFVDDVVVEIERKAKAADVYYPFVYMNDAVRGQRVYEHYGSGKSLPKMKRISMAYDPEQVFQRLEASGFKLG